MKHLRTPSAEHFLCVLFLGTALGVPLQDIADPFDGNVYQVDGEEFADACLKAHNNLRKMHGVGKLTYDAELASSASEWAKYNSENRLKPAKHASKEVRKEEGFGESLFTKTGLEPAGPENAVFSWYKGRLCWDYQSNATVDTNECINNPTGHFTQEIWKSSETVGCGMAFAAEDKVIGKRTYRIIRSYIVARYSPPGNRKSAMGFNVLPPNESIPAPDLPSDLLLNWRKFKSRQTLQI